MHKGRLYDGLLQETRAKELHLDKSWQCNKKWDRLHHNDEEANIQRCLSEQLGQNWKRSPQGSSTLNGQRRVLFGVSLRGRLLNENTCKKASFTDIVHSIVKLKWRWAGNIARRTDSRWGQRVLEWKTLCSQNTYLDDLIKVTGICWMQVAQDRPLWRFFGKIYVQKWTSFC